MKPIKTLMLAALLLVLPACSVSTRSVSPAVRPQIATIDSALLQKCDLPIDLGTNALAQAQLEKLWISDRKRLLTCYRRHLALRDVVVSRDAGLRGDP
ncbi:dehydrogenase [Pararhizobium sp.]|uniref:dehydrogenase n=1 Tax=Pararhizobium sp. TaxID=1977563 RepID=UPI003BAD9A94